MKQCPKCGTSWTTVSNFCGRDGTPLVELVLPKCVCGNTLVSLQKFCDHCGLPRADALGQVETQSPAA